MDDAPILSLHDVTRRYGKLEAVSRAAFELRPGRITCLLGPSGCGKSTVLRMIAGLEPVDAGEIVLRGEVVSSPRLTVPPEKRGVGLVFQDNALFPHLDVRGNVGFALTGMNAADRQARIEALLARFHVEHLARAWPHTLSGGEQQRVAIARALALEPAVLLLDEPFSGLDSNLRARVRRSLLNDLRAVGTSVLIVTHDPDEALGIADDLVLMAGGRVLQAGDPAQCYDDPVSAIAASLLGEAIIFPAHVRQGMATTPFGSVPAPGEADGPAEMMVRPACIALAQEGTRALLHSSRRLGAEWLLDLSVNEVAFSLRTQTTPPAPGEEVLLSIDRVRARIYPRA